MKFENCIPVTNEEQNTTRNLLVKIKQVFEIKSIPIKCVKVRDDTCLIVDTEKQINSFYSMKPLAELGLFISGFESRSYPGGSKFWLRPLE